MIAHLVQQLHIARLFDASAISLLFSEDLVCRNAARASDKYGGSRRELTTGEEGMITRRATHSNYFSRIVWLFQCDELWNKLRNKDLDLKRALMRISELENRVSTGTNGRVHRRFNHVPVMRSTSLRAMAYESSPDESPIWVSVASADGANDEFTTKGLSNGHGPSEKIVEKPIIPSLELSLVPVHLSRRDKCVKDIIVPGIYVNGKVKQEAVSMKWEVFADEEDSDPSANDSEIEKTISQLRPAITSLSLPVLGRGSGSISEASCYSDASVDSDT